MNTSIPQEAATSRKRKEKRRLQSQEEFCRRPIVAESTCEVDLDLLAEHVKGQKFHRRSHGPPRIVDQRRDTNAAHCRLHLIMISNNHSRLTRLKLHAVRRRAIVQRQEVQLNRIGWKMSQIISSAQPHMLSFSSFDKLSHLLNSIGDADLIGDVQDDRRDVAMRRGSHVSVGAAPHTGKNTPALQAGCRHISNDCCKQGYQDGKLFKLAFLRRKDSRVTRLVAVYRRKEGCMTLTQQTVCECKHRRLQEHRNAAQCKVCTVDGVHAQAQGLLKCSPPGTLECCAV